MTRSRRSGNYFRLLEDRGAIPSLDGLRGVAILLVVVFHGIESFAVDGPLLPLGRFDLAAPLYSGWMGVNLFFVLSGFLITHHLLRRWEGHVSRADIGQYLLMRWIRIVPTYYIVLVIAASGIIPFHTVQTEYLGWQVLYHLFFLQDYLPSGILGPFWSLGVEEKFYLIMPVALLIAWKLRNVRHQLVFLFAVAVLPLVIRLLAFPGAATAADESFLRDWRNPFHLNLDGLFLGAACAWIFAKRSLLPGLRRSSVVPALAWSGCVLIAVLTIGQMLPGNRGFFHQVALYPLTAAAMAAILLATLLRSTPGSRLLERRVLAGAGRIAYSWYLTHVLVMHWLWGGLTASVPELLALPATIQAFVFLPLYFAVSLFAALALHYTVEKPCLILKDRVASPRPGAVAVPAASA
jgi:peptidoglycan/LPS O-acetylase OafA/YrhL